MIKCGAYSRGIRPVGDVVISPPDGQRHPSRERSNSVELPTADYLVEYGGIRLKLFSGTEWQLINSTNHHPLGNIRRIQASLYGAIEFAILPQCTRNGPNTIGRRR